MNGLENRMLKSRLFVVRHRVMLLLFALGFILSSSPAAHAENRLYYLRVTLQSGERYETISACDPYSYCSRNGGVVKYLVDYSFIYSPHMKVKVLRSWIEPTNNLAAKWPDILRAYDMLNNHNQKALPRLQPLRPADLCRPE
jgi:hypothetical protein